MLSVVVGFFVGSLVGATGIGGGILLTPLLIVVLHVSPIVAVGTALLIMSLTKVIAVLIHWRQNTIDFRLSSQLLSGSVPGAFVGSKMLVLLQDRLGQGVNDVLRTSIGICLMIFALVSVALDCRGVFNSLLQKDGALPVGTEKKAMAIGFAGGFLVSATSIGSGSLIMLLLLVYCKRRPAHLVGTDLFHGMILTMAAAIFHSRIGGIDLPILWRLLIGSIPGAMLGANVTMLMKPLWLRRVLLVLSAVGGFMML